MTPTDGVPAADSSADVPVQRSLVGPRLNVAVGADGDGAPASVPCQPARILGADSGLSLGDRAILAALCHWLTGRGRRVARTVMSATSALGGLQGVARVPQCGARGVPVLLDSAVWQDLMLIGKAAR